MFNLKSVVLLKKSERKIRVWSERERVNERKSEIEKRKKERKKERKQKQKMQGGENIIPICLFIYHL